MSTYELIDEIRKKVDALTDEAFNEGYKTGKADTESEIDHFMKWLNNEVAIIGKDQDGKTHILVARRVQEDPEKLVWADAVQEFNLRNQQPEDPEKIKLNHPSDQMDGTPEPPNENTNKTLPFAEIISSDGSEVSE